ncbi:MAG TPA: exopolyphosphatase, partial [Nocardioides sp.]|nr:exopolyphosphatase [Nocardioides sp.]
PGFHTSTPPTDASEYGVYWPALVPVDEVEHRVVLPDGTVEVVPPGPTAPFPELVPTGPVSDEAPSGPVVEVPLGRICAARSGDKGGNANVGLWTRDDASYDWLRSHLTVDRFRELVPEAAGLEVRRWDLPNLRALNFVVVGLLGHGVAASPRPDPQAKGLGEYVRSRVVPVPAYLVGGSS